MIPTEAAPAATAAKAYSICTNFPEGLHGNDVKCLVYGNEELNFISHLNVVKEKLYRSDAIVTYSKQLCFSAIKVMSGYETKSYKNKIRKAKLKNDRADFSSRFAVGLGSRKKLKISQ